MQHLNTMQDLVKGAEAEQHVIAVKNQFQEICGGFTSYDWTVVRQQMYKFFEDRHIKVSLFI